MIVEARQNESSDVASIRTLVTAVLQKPPRHLVKLFYTSLFVSLLCFVFGLVNNISLAPLETIPTILAFVLLLPHHSASLLLLWLHHHQSESIIIKFPFTPYSPRALAYAIFLIVMWGASTGMCATNLYFSSRLMESTCTYGTYSSNPLDPLPVPVCSKHRTPFNQYWTAFAATLTSSLELILVIVIAIVCYMHKRHKPAPAPVAPPPPSSDGSLSESKVISA